MLGIGTSEMVVIAIIALLVVGPDRLPHVMRQAGRWYGQLRRAADDLRRAFVLEADRQDAADRYRQLQERRKQAQELRKKALEEAGGEGAVQPENVPTPQPPPHPLHAPQQTSVPHQASPPVDGGDGAPAPLSPNDIPPDAPHPDPFRAHGDPR